MENDLINQSIDKVINLTIFQKSNIINDTINPPHSFNELFYLIRNQYKNNDKFFIYYINNNNIIPIQNENDYEKLINSTQFNLKIEVKNEPYKELKKTPINENNIEKKENNNIKNFNKNKKNIKNAKNNQIDSIKKIVDERIENFRPILLKQIKYILKNNYANINQKLIDFQKDILNLLIPENNKKENNKKQENDYFHSEMKKKIKNNENNISQNQSISESQYNDINKNNNNLFKQNSNKIPINKSENKKIELKKNLLPNKNQYVVKNEKRENNNFNFNRETPFKVPTNLDISNTSNKDEPKKVFNKNPDNNNNNIENNNEFKNNKKNEYNNNNNNYNNNKENKNNEINDINKDKEKSNIKEKKVKPNYIGYNESEYIYLGRNPELKNEDNLFKKKDSNVLDNAELNAEKYNEEDDYSVDYQNCVKNILLSSLIKKEAFINLALKNNGNANWPRNCYLCFVKEGNEEDGLYFEDEIINGGKEVAPEQTVKVRIYILKEKNYKNNKEDYLINYEIRQNKLKSLNKKQSGVTQINVIRRNSSVFK